MVTTNTVSTKDMQEAGWILRSVHYAGDTYTEFEPLSYAWISHIPEQDAVAAAPRSRTRRPLDSETHSRLLRRSLREHSDIWRALADQ